MASITCEGVSSGYGDTVIIRDVSMRIEGGEIFALIGKNGAGKTTLLKTLIGLVATRSGSIALLGNDVTSWPTHRIVAEGVSYAPQENAFFSELSVDENLRMGSLRLDGRSYLDRRDRVVEMFPFIGRRLRQRASTLSGGEQAMVKVARALLPTPRLVLLDEVSEGLQPKALHRVGEVLAAYHRESGAAVLLVEQNVNFVRGIAQRFGLIARGQIAGTGSFADSDAQRRILDHMSF